MLQTLLLALALVPSQGGENIDFRQGTLSGWEGEGFYLTSGDGRGVSRELGVCSSDAGSPKRKGLIRYVFTVPSGMTEIRFRAFAARPAGGSAEEEKLLDVLLLGRGRRVIPRRIKTKSGWQRSLRLEGRLRGEPHLYSWNISQFRGQPLQIVIVDRDERPNAYTFASHFRFMPLSDDNIDLFANQMVKLVDRNQLSPVFRYDSKRFTALSNADERFTKRRLHNCELLYDMFMRHFRAKGFRIYHPSERLAIAVFDTPEGYGAYIGRRLPPSVTGIYHRGSNRLVIYDQVNNTAIAAKKKRALAKGKSIRSAIQRITYVKRVELQTKDLTSDINISTVMHETAHQVSFNCGLLNRKGDVPVWLAEGLACYCEPTYNGQWHGIGGPNIHRLEDLDRWFKRKRSLIPLRTLLGGDRWRNSRSVVVGYAQSWALFHMLMHSQPRKLGRYLELVRQRRAPDHRLTDFGEVFGGDLGRMEKQLRSYIDGLIRDHVRR